MANRKLAKAIRKLPKQLWKQYRSKTKAITAWLIRTLMVLKRHKRQLRTSGFILPTTVLLLLVVSLTVAALVFRAYNNTSQSIGERQQRVIYNAATPAIDRARAKIENLFDPNRDSRYPGGVPAENVLAGMLRNDGSYGVSALAGADQYTLPDETRINLDNTTKTGEKTGNDNAWAFRTDTDGDGAKDATVVYSILLQVPPDLANAGVKVPGSGVVSTNDKDKADSLWVRTAPLSNRQRGNCGVAANANQAASAAQGWFEQVGSSAILRKNFQIDALVIPDDVTTRPNFVTLEMQHDRQLDRGNKWAAWFRNDLTLYPGNSGFSFNGAIHTEGSLIVRPKNNNGTRFYLVSAQNSCLMSTATNSEITATEIKNPNADPKKKPDFMGGVLSGSVVAEGDGTVVGLGYGSSSQVDVWPANANGPSLISKLDSTTQSHTTTKSPSNISLDPATLLTRDISLARSDTDKSNRATIRPAWKELPSGSANPRIRNQVEPKPYVDDFYRADDRWGPKPRYNDNIILTGAAQQPGTLIPDTYKASLKSDTPTSPNDDASVGLDGYWERRARNEGMRIIVGQRLELGNSDGWRNSLTTAATAAEQAKADPMYPINTTVTHEQRQRRTLRDNIAAVQAAAIYHSGNTAGKDFPVACLASTSHPGTAATLRASINFDPAQINNTYYGADGKSIPIVTNFLNGRGTNGWEFYPPATPFPATAGAASTPATEADFISAIAATEPLGKALRNLAYMAGDYVSDTQHGAFPPSQIAGEVHPDPLVTMWGNFSELRRTLARLDGTGGSYDTLSVADKTNLHTAACMIGMLAYNVDAAVKADVDKTLTAVGLDAPGQRVSTGVDIWKNFSDNSTLVSQYCKSGSGSSSNPYICDLPQLTSLSPTDPLLLGITPGSNKWKLISVIVAGEQVDRDRRFGFSDSTVANGGISSTRFPVRDGGKYYEFNVPTSCDPRNTTDLANPLVVLTNGADTSGGLDTKQGGLLMLCATKPRYPSLFYLFPKVNHDQDGDAANKNDQPPAEEYSSNTYVKTTLNGTTTYQVVGATVDDFSAVKLPPKGSITPTTTSLTDSNFSDWVLPNSAPQNIAGANESSNRIYIGGTTRRAVGFLGRVLLNGREHMATRVMDIDVGMLRGQSNATATGGQPWLPKSGIVYAFREDAVREDAIARPGGGTQTTATSSLGTDPALVTTAEGIQMSTKQVDYIADPDRRPHGFRLRNGAQIKRNASFNIPDADSKGLTFVSDNPVYIQGNFNLHQSGNDDVAFATGVTGNALEEFTTRLNGTYGDFYKRETLDTSFARPGSDRWRPAEILADAVTFLSDNFCEGSISDTFLKPNSTTINSTYHIATASTSNWLWSPGCAATTAQSSFTAQNLPTGTVTWLKENGATSSTDTSNISPVRVDRNGSPIKSDGSTHTAFETFDNNSTDTVRKAKLSQATADTRINAIIVSGTVPFRANQGDGGLHNFPRFLENWEGKSLIFAGSFLQLNFSNYATGPFELDAWEPAAAPKTDEYLNYYWPPTRAWGYDPALQLAPAGPAAARFVTANKSRSEYYNEVSISDPYMKKLCEAFKLAPKSDKLAGAPAGTNVTCP